MTHEDLVERTAKWLRSKGYGTVVTRKAASGFEEPDAIGWKANGHSLLVECKASVADFRRDAGKSFRRLPALGMGSERVYMTPPDLLRPDMMPELWGLAEARQRGVRVVVEPQPHLKKNTGAELRLLLAHARLLEGVTRPIRRPAGGRPCLT